MTLPFASLIQEIAPLKLAHAPHHLETFVQDGGGFALLGLCFWLAVSILRSLSPQFRQAGFQLPVVVLGVAVLALALYATGGVLELLASSQAQQNRAVPVGGTLESPVFSKTGNRLMTAGGAIALLGVFVPFLRDSRELRFRRIWALARLSFIEALRSRVLWVVFLGLLLPFMFPPKWWDPTLNPKDEIAASLSTIYAGATPLLLLAAAGITAFSIPADIRNQTIHTVVTKPVQKFEIVIGRFVGYMGLTSIVLAGVMGLSLALIAVSNVHPQARAESMKARIPVMGDLGFLGRPGTTFQGESVGREWEYRRYVPGGPNTPYRAAWYFFDLDRDLANRDSVTCEFDFDIFRTTKGEEGKGVFCTFFVVTHQANANLAETVREYERQTRGLSPRARPAGPGVSPTEAADWAKLNQVAGQLGYFEYRAKEISDYHTDSIALPGALFTKAMEGTPPPMEVAGRGPVTGARVVVLVRCDSKTQFIGVAQPDLYLLAGERAGFWYFGVNYFKGALGLWLQLMLVIGIAVTCSTYLNGVVSFLATTFLVILGYNRWFILMIAVMPVVMTDTPGPADSLRKLVTGEALATAADERNAAHQVTAAFDEGYKWCLRRLMNLLPNMERLSWTEYVKKGFNVPNEELAMNFVFVAGYLSLWAAAGHFLMKWREVATW